MLRFNPGGCGSRRKGLWNACSNAGSGGRGRLWPGLVGSTWCSSLSTLRQRKHPVKSGSMDCHERRVDEEICFRLRFTLNGTSCERHLLRSSTGAGTSSSSRSACPSSLSPARRQGALTTAPGRSLHGTMVRVSLTYAWPVACENNSNSEAQGGEK